MLNKHLFSVFFLFALAANAQEKSPARLEMIAGLAKYRNELITGNATNFEQLRKLDILWKQDQEKKELVSSFLFNFIFLSVVYNYPAERITRKLLKLIEKNDPDFFLKPILTEEYVNLILEEKGLIDLLSAGILQPDPPFKIDPETWLFHELDFYQIKNGMHIAEVGAGDGVFSLMLGLAYDSLTVYVNELDPFARDYAEDKINQCNSKKSGNKFLFIRGKRKSAMLKSHQIDKVIIRNSFHHFERKTEMLASIQQSLAPGGSLYIYDPTFQHDKEFACGEIMEKSALRSALLENGFDIVEEQENEWGWLLLHCKPKRPD